jgi:hypothetical protein
MTLRLTQLYFALVALAIAAVSLTGSSARAFTMESLGSGDGNSRFADPDDQVKNFGGTQGAQPFGPNGPIVQFGAHQGPIGAMGPFGHFQGNGFNNPPPDPYSRPLGNGD